MPGATWPVHCRFTDTNGALSRFTQCGRVAGTRAARHQLLSPWRERIRVPMRFPLCSSVVFQVGGATMYALRARVVRTRGLLARSCLWRAVRCSDAPRVVVAHAAITDWAHLPWSGRNECGLPGHWG